MTYNTQTNEDSDFGLHRHSNLAAANNTEHQLKQQSLVDSWSNFCAEEDEVDTDPTTRLFRLAQQEYADDDDEDEEDEEDEDDADEDIDSLVEGGGETLRVAFPSLDTCSCQQEPPDPNPLSLLQANHQTL